MQTVRELRQRLWTESDEPIKTFALKIARLVDLAFSKSNTCTSDAFLDNLPPNFQRYVKLDASSMTNRNVN